MALEFNTNLIKVTSNFLKFLDVPISKTSLKTLLITNPYYPSLYSLSDVFNKLNIENKSFKIETEKLDELPLPFLAYIDIKEIGAKDFVNVTNISGNTVTYYYKKEITVQRIDFINKWSNIVFLAQPNEKTKDINFVKNTKIESQNRNKSILLVLGFSLILLTAIFSFIKNSSEIFQSSIFIVNILIGMTASVLLLIHEVDKSNAFVKNICEGGVKSNCDAVLSSNASKIFNISWSELGFFYFSFLLIYSLFPFISYEVKKSFLTLFLSLTALYIPFSIYYQYKIIKQWCRLCLIIQFVLFIGFLWILAFGSFKFQFSLNNILILIFSAFFPMLIWYTIKPLLIKATDSEKYFSSYRRLFTNPEVFKVIISEQPDAPEGWEFLGIQKGNINAGNIIIKICSPTCKPCAQAHSVFNEILKFNDNVKVITIYEVDSEDENDFRRIFVSHMLALAELNNGNDLEKAMDYWYLNESRTFETLVEKYPVSKDMLKSQKSKIEAMRIWCKNAEVQYTPTVYLNGKKLSKEIHVEELKNIL
jgi:uncharacterized membrane protein/thiol-disulfide isomerase/thioredoxin